MTIDQEAIDANLKAASEQRKGFEYMYLATSHNTEGPSRVGHDIQRPHISPRP